MVQDLLNCEINFSSNRKYSPQCESCNQSIIPKEGSTETIRVVAMDKNYHLECYICKG
jgi:hypothetical protein